METQGPEHRSLLKPLNSMVYCVMRARNHEDDPVDDDR